VSEGGGSMREGRKPAKGLDGGDRVNVSFMPFDHGGPTSLARF
jgi:hypothetical protein